MNDTTISTRLSDFAADFALEQVPADVRRRATYLMLDAIGIALASTQFDFAHKTLAALKELGGNDGTSPVIGTGQRLPLRDAVSMNALLVHGLDYDDTHPRGVIHATASVLPLALGVAAKHGLSGARVLSAYLLGVEAATRIGAAARGGFHQVGFHPTGLVGAFGCTLAAGHLLGLSAARLAHAQGIALSLASGSLEFLQDGAWTKRFHPGWAGVAGLTAATLARHDFIGPQAPYEGRFGLYASHLGPLLSECDLALITAGLGEVWETTNIAIKPVPACHFTHACADSAAALHEQWAGAPIKRIRALVAEGVMKTVCEPIETKRQPANAYDAQFSIPYSVATGLLKGRFTLDALDPTAYTDPQTLAIAAKVQCEADPDADFPRVYSGEVIVELEDGRVLRHREAVNRGAADRPISEDDIVVKFHENAARAVSRAHADAVARAVLGVEQGDAAELARLLSVPARGQT